MAIDCEFVSSKRKNSVTGKHNLLLASVAIVNWKKEIVYSIKVKQNPGTFIVNRITLKINGYAEHDLEDGIAYEDVVADVQKITLGKVIIVHGGSQDLRLLQIDDCVCFDLQTVFRQTGRNGVQQPISLKRLTRHYFGRDIQARVHCATEDAIATLELFQDVYRKIALKKKCFGISYTNTPGEFDNIL